MWLVAVEIASVLAMIGPAELTVPLLLPVDERTFVVAAVRPYLDAIAMLFVLSPLPLVHTAIGVHVLPKAVCLVVLEAAFVHIALDSYQAALAFGVVVFPEPFVRGTISPAVRPKPTAIPLTVDRPLIHAVLIGKLHDHPTVRCCACLLNVQRHWLDLLISQLQYLCTKLVCPIWVSIDVCRKVGGQSGLEWGRCNAPLLLCVTLNTHIM
jgi:hypothetical protein